MDITLTVNAAPIALVLMAACTIAVAVTLLGCALMWRGLK